MDINDNQQINSFTGGMNTDTSDAMLQADQYRYAENVRVVTNTEENTGELSLIEGNKFTCRVDGEILYFTSIREYIILVIRKNNTWSVVVSKDDCKSLHRVFGPCSEAIWDSTGKAELCGVVRYESSNNIKLYLTDATGNHNIMQFFVDEEHWTKVYTDLKMVYGYIQSGLPAPKVSISQSYGTMKPARVQYLYRMYRYGAAATQTSPLSNILSLYKSDTEGYLYGENASSAVDIEIDTTNDLGLDRIQLYRITYEQVGQQPTCALVKDVAINDSYTILTDDGTNISTLSVDELTALDTISIKPKIIESKQDYLLAANIKYETDDVDELFFETKKIDVKAPAGSGKYVSWSLQEVWTDMTLFDGQDKKIQGKYYKHGETYRFGAILYDTKGRKSSVRHIADITIPDFGNDDIKINIKKENNKPIGVTYSMRQYYIRFTFSNMPTEVSAVQVVRCVRGVNDTKIIAQGIVGHPMRLYDRSKAPNDSRTEEDGKTNLICPSGFMSLQYVVSRNHDSWDNWSDYKTKIGKTEGQIVQFASPEYVYATDDVKNIISAYKDSIKLEHVISYDVFSRRKGGSDSYSRIWSWLYPEYGFRVRPQKRWSYDNSWILIKEGASNFNEDNINRISDGNRLLPFITDPSDKYKWGYISFNHTLPANVISGNRSLKVDYGSKITKSAYPEVPDWNAFANGDNIRFQDDVTVIDTDSYINWSFPLGLNSPLGTSGDTEYKETIYNAFNIITHEEGGSGKYGTAGYNNLTYHYPIGTGGKCILFKLNKSLDPYYYTPVSWSAYDSSDIYYGHLFPIHVANLVKPTTPYGGNDEYAIKNSVYYQYGDYAKCTGNVSIDVKSGDATAMVFTYNANHNWYDAQFTTPTKMGTVYQVPIETSIDLRATAGQLLTNNTQFGYYAQDKASAFDGYSQQKDAYLYNTAYGAEPLVLPQSTVEKVIIEDNNFDSRVHYSDVKTNGEHIDNWTRFKAANFTDVDTRQGGITNMRLFKDQMIFWQTTAVGKLRVNERAVIQSVDSTQLVLGSGGVLDGYDYLSTVYGMKKGQFADGQSNTALYWWDGTAKEILQLAESVVPLSIAKNVSNHIHQHEEVEKPHLVYDNKYKEMMFSVVEGGAITYNEFIAKFTAVYKYMPLFSTQVFEKLFTTTSDTIYQYNTPQTTGKAILDDVNITPLVRYVVNKNNMYVKTFDITTFGGRFYGGDSLTNLVFDYKTPLKQHSKGTGKDLVTNREYDFRLAIPRNNNSAYGDRMRGKTMQCEISSTSNSTDFSLQYTITKYRMSWS